VLGETAFAVQAIGPKMLPTAAPQLWSNRSESCRDMHRPIRAKFAEAARSRRPRRPGCSESRHPHENWRCSTASSFQAQRLLNGGSPSRALVGESPRMSALRSSGAFNVAYWQRGRAEGQGNWRRNQSNRKRPLADVRCAPRVRPHPALRLSARACQFPASGDERSCTSHNLITF
jgi:hypothetical protein